MKMKKTLPFVLSAAFSVTVLPGVMPAPGASPLPLASEPLPLTGVVCTQAGAAVAKAQTADWKFKKDLDGWKYGGKYGYKGNPEISQSEKFGGTIEIKADFSQVKDSGWSEIKLEYGGTEKEPLDVTGSNVVTYQLYYQPKHMTCGAFKTKVYAKDTSGNEVINASPSIDMEKAKDAGDGWKVVPVTVDFDPVAAPLSYFIVSVVGSNTDYTGDLYVGKLGVHYAKRPDGYVNVTEKVTTQTPVDIKALALPQTVALVDPKVSPQTAAAYAFLKGLAATDQVVYGHQNEMNRKVAKNLPGASDTYDIVKDYSGIVGVDALALTGDELELTDAEKAAGETYSAKLARLVLPAAKRGAIVTMSMHMPNFALVAKKPKVDGHYDYAGYSPNVTSGDVVKRILPGGDLNPVYTQYLDLVADFLGRMQQADVPVIFRPFHENNGSWFWWGASYSSASQFKNLFRYTVTYMRDTKGLHNLLYAYSPNGPFKDVSEYASRYPGDAFVDITGFDLYHRDPARVDGWMDSFDATMKVVDHFADLHQKLAAVTETGVLVGNQGNGLAKSGNKRLNWINEALARIAPHEMAYFMTWSNFNEVNFAQPYLVSLKRGHEMVNAFIDFYDAPQTVFAEQMPNLSAISVQAVPAAKEYGYLTAPNAMERVLAPMTLTAKAAGGFQSASFAILRKDGSVAATVPAVSDDRGEITGALTDEALALAGKTFGAIELRLDGKAADSVQVFFNLPAPPADPALVDDFESYYGDGSLLKGAYVTNCGAGCSAEPLLSERHQGGEAGLDFHYMINKGGYGGIIKSLKGVDWSAYDAIQFWLTPDGKGQKLIIQTNSNGEDFEVDLSALAKTTQPQLVTLPFSQFKGKNGGTFDKSAVQHFAIYCNTIGDATVDSHMYFDDIRAVK